MRLVRIGVALTAVNLVLLIALLLEGRPVEAQDVPAVLTGRSLEIVDEAGQRRFQLTTESNGEAVFRIRDQKGTIRVKIGASEEGSGLLLLDDNTEPGLHALAKRQGTSLVLKRAAAETVLRPEAR